MVSGILIALPPSPFRSCLVEGGSGGVRPLLVGAGGGEERAEFGDLGADGGGVFFDGAVAVVPAG